MPLHAYLGWPGPVTHRQHAAWLAWDELQWNVPSRTDHYLARLACEIRRVPLAVWGKNAALNPNEFLLKFVLPGERKRLSAEEQAAADAACKARWRAFLGRKG